MHWYWKVRIYRTDGQYSIGVVKTERDLKEIAFIQDFYQQLTGEKMLLMGMYDSLPKDSRPIVEAFAQLWGSRATWEKPAP